MEYFFERRKGYRRHVPRGWDEYAFVKMYPDKNQAIVVATTFDSRTRTMRDSGEDAIRTMIGLLDPVILPAVMLKSTRRLANWDYNLNRRLDLLESLIPVSPRCPRCGSAMIPRARSDRTDGFWSCSLYRFRECSGTVPMRRSLAERLLPELPTPKSHRYY
jgi:hypothetical protein